MIPDLHGCPHCPYTGGLKYVKAHLAKRPHPTALERDILTGLSAHMISRVNYRVTPYTPSNPLPSTPSLAMQIAAADLDTSAPVAANARLVSPFLNRTKWHEIREPFNEHLPELVELASFPSETEFPLLADVVRTYFRKADALFEHTEELVLQHLNTHDPAKSGINNTPFHRHHMGDTTAQQYVVVVIRLIAALLRQSNVFSMEPSEPLTLAIEALRASLLDHRQDVKDAQPHLHVIFGALWHSRWRQTATTRMPDPTMRFLMLLSSQPGGEFAAPKDTSGPIRKLCWAIQMHALAEIHRIVEVEGVFQMEAYNRVSEFTLSMPKIWWLDRETWQEMLYKGHKITLLQLQEVFTNLEAEITSMWEDMVLLGLDLNVEWSEIADDLTEKRAGYSFLEDERNPFHAFKDAFAKALDADLETRKKFTTAASNYTELDLIKCREWLFRLAKLEGLVMLIIDMLGGAPPRGTELTSMLACNSPFRLRNLAALGKFIAIIRQYDKTSNITQSDRLIPHSISAVAADILIQIHTIARPWAKFLASKVWPRDPNVSRAYGEMLFMDVGQMFTSDKLTHLMATKTGHVLGWEVTIASWRHINIAWRRKLCGGSAELLDQEAMSTVNALQGGHSSHTENMVYGLSPDALAGAPEDVLFLFLVASGEWQKLLQMVPGGLGLNYKAACCSKFRALVASGVIERTRKTIITCGTVESAEASASLSHQLAKVHLEVSENQQEANSKQDQTLAILAQIQQHMSQLEITVRQRSTAPPTPRSNPSPHKMVVDPPQPKQKMPETSNSVPSSQSMIISTPSRQAAPIAPVHRLDWFSKPGSSQRQSQSISQSASSQRPNQPMPHSAFSQTQHPSVSQSASLQRQNPPASPRSTVGSSTPKRLRRSTPTSTPKRQINVLSAVRELLGNPTAGWKDITQYEGIRECLALQRDVVITSKTGSGKTLIAVVPSLIEDAITVIVVPLISLLEDWERRLDEFGLAYERFKGAAEPTIAGRANLVLVTSDMVKEKAWETAAHYYAADYEFRPEALAKPYRIRGFNFQIALLSATVSEPAFQFLTREFELERPLRITSGSHRPELELIIQHDCKSSADQLQRAHSTISQYVQHPDWKPEDRWILFVSSLIDGENYAKALGVPFYKAAKDPLKEEEDLARQQNYKAWAVGKTIGLVASNALGGGTDYAHVRLTIHINTPWDATLFEQQRGRAGRDGERAYNYIIARDQPWVGSKTPHPVFGDLVGTQVVSDLVYKQPPKFPDRCLIFQLTRFFDGTGHTCHEYARSALCTACKHREYESHITTRTYLYDFS
ncbi:hypothetical protein K438DRAFT_1618458 [Mycena galopus ATCC 62051]|nr:hypothetical protein K438DRAFT_1618458 [Mycena galopus ATCC 62051]